MVTVTEITNYNDYKSFKEADDDILRVLKLGAPWCGPCRMLSNTISNLNEDKVGSTIFAEIDIDGDGLDDVVSELSIRNIPVTLFIKNGVILEKKVGSIQENDIYNIINNNQ
jgi:thioredoxin 1